MKTENWGDAAKGVLRGGLRALKACFRWEVVVDRRSPRPWLGRAEEAHEWAKDGMGGSGWPLCPASASALQQPGCASTLDASVDSSVASGQAQTTHAVL